MLGMVEIPAKAGASAHYSCLPAGREGGVKALPFQTGFTLIVLTLIDLFLCGQGIIFLDLLLFFC
jgi:hypothetical protein